jgi:hypothetical protein
MQEVLGRSLRKEEDPEVAVRRRIRETDAEVQSNLKAFRRTLEGIGGPEKSREAWNGSCVSPGFRHGSGNGTR